MHVIQKNTQAVHACMYVYVAIQGIRYPSVLYSIATSPADQYRPENQNQAAATSPAPAPNNLSLHSPQTASNPLTTSPHSLPASLSFNFRSQSPRSSHREPSSRPSSSRRSSATSSRAERRRREAVDVNWRDS